MANVAASTSKASGRALSFAARSSAAMPRPIFPRHGQVSPAAPSRRHIALRGLPRTTTPDDVRRFLQRQSIGNVTNVQLEYYNFYPNGTAILTLSGAQHYNDVMDQLQRQHRLYGHTLVAAPTPAPNMNMGQTPGNSRAKAGVESDAAVSRKGVAALESEAPAMGDNESARFDEFRKPRDWTAGILAGNGVQAGVAEVGRSVCILGLPVDKPSSTIRAILESRGFSFSIDQPQKKVGAWRVASPPHALSGRLLVKLSSEAEAHRLVRELHMTYHYKHLIQARVIL